MLKHSYWIVSALAMHLAGCGTSIKATSDTDTEGVEICGNGFDDDGDLLIDCEDSDCATWCEDADTDAEDSENEDMDTEADMPPLPTGTLVVNTTPDEATVTIDSHDNGTTPLEAEVVAGWHRVELNKDGYYGWVGDVEVVEDETATLDIELEEIPVLWRDMSGTWIREDTSEYFTVTQDHETISGFPGGDLVMDWSAWTLAPAVIDDWYFQGMCDLDATPYWCLLEERPAGGPVRFHRISP